jgi:hypothetical protein
LLLSGTAAYKVFKLELAKSDCLICVWAEVEIGEGLVAPGGRLIPRLLGVWEKRRARFELGFKEDLVGLED